MKNITVKYIDTSNYEVQVISDENPDSSREWDNLGTMICSHRDYELGDEQLIASEYDGWDEVEEMLYKEREAVIVLPLNLYDHSGISMSIGNGRGWDNGVVGFIYVDKDTLRREYGVKRITKKILERAEQVLRGEVETYNMYLTGEVYGVVVTDSAGNEITNVWGVYGDEGVKSEILYAIPDALPENVNITGIGYGGYKYDVYFDYSDVKKGDN